MRILISSRNRVSSAVGKLAARKMWSTTFTDNHCDAVFFVQQIDYQVVIMNLEEPDELSALRAIRMNAPSLPIVAVLPPNNSMLRSASWKAGALICVSSDASTNELEMAVLAITRLISDSPDHLVTIGGLELDLECGEAKAFGSHIPLTRMEYLLLERLVLSRGRTVSRDALLDHLYELDDWPTAKVIDVMISKMRKKLVASGISRNGIGTNFGHGYRIVKNELLEPLAA